MSRTDEYLDRARTALEDLRAQIDALRVQVDLGSAEARDRLQQSIAKLQNLQQDARERVDKAQNAAVDAWGQVARQAETAIAAAGDHYERLLKEWESATSPVSSAARVGFDAFRAEWKRRRDEREKLIDNDDKK